MMGTESGHLGQSDSPESEGALEVTANTAPGHEGPEWGELDAEITETLAPQKPAPTFRDELKRELMERAHGHPEREIQLEAPQPYRELIIGAAIGSAVALAGGLVYLLRLRGHTRARPIGTEG
jgi:hypothetical protein